MVEPHSVSLGLRPSINPRTLTRIAAARKLSVGCCQAEDAPAGPGPVKEKAEADGDVPERDGREIKAAPVFPVV